MDDGDLLHDSHCGDGCEPRVLGLAPDAAPPFADRPVGRAPERRGIAPPSLVISTSTSFPGRILIAKRLTFFRGREVGLCFKSIPGPFLTGGKLRATLYGTHVRRFHAPNHRHSPIDLVNKVERIAFASYVYGKVGKTRSRKYTNVREKLSSMMIENSKNKKNGVCKQIVQKELHTSSLKTHFQGINNIGKTPLPKKKNNIGKTPRIP